MSETNKSQQKSVEGERGGKQEATSSLLRFSGPLLLLKAQMENDCTCHAAFSTGNHKVFRPSLVRNPDSLVRLLGFSTWLGQLWVEYPWVNPLTNLSVTFLTCHVRQWWYCSVTGPWRKIPWIHKREVVRTGHSTRKCSENATSTCDGSSSMQWDPSFPSATRVNKQDESCPWNWPLEFFYQFPCPTLLGMPTSAIMIIWIH